MTAVQPYQPPSSPAPLDIDFLAPGALKLRSTFDATTEHGKQHILKALGQCEKSLSEYIGMELEISDVVVHVVTLDVKDVLGNPTGETIDAPRTVLVTTDGTFIQCVSKGALRSLQLLASFYGAPSMASPYKVLVRQLDVGQNRRTYELAPVLAKASAKSKR